ncbi:DUF1189 domain-containing protein [Oceanobacillus chungangensis]|uniref:DUF1189 domain-containing protein n=1 Tax=Oceanobacillus chungangensis TaxID=1229152 RepID=A0A3D8PIY4_9BACI|nr:DUF1189 domain-containing protein [Oceanobacillus chungangensis]RDW15612.1 DUF1189 domain-containing protein [Oceanobacillus chungangensis]
MKTDTFPLNYFKTIWTPIKVFKGRHQLNWLQIIIIILFLNALIMIPVSLSFAKMDSFPIEGTFPNAFSLIDESVVTAMKEAEFSNGEMELHSSFLYKSDKGGIGGSLSKEEADELIKEENAILFLANRLLIKEGKNPVSEVKYTKDFSVKNITTVNELKTAISQQWFIQNKSFVVGSLILAVFSLSLASIVFIVLGSSIFIYFTRKGQFSSIKTFKESVNLIVNAMGLATLMSMVIGVIRYDMITILLIQSFGTVLMILAVFYKTRFSDELAA